jgi:polyphosphate kinase
VPCGGRNKDEALDGRPRRDGIERQRPGGRARCRAAKPLFQPRTLLARLQPARAGGGLQPGHPLLERLRFLSISGDNLDEFFMVRVAGLKGQQLLNVEERSMDGLTPSQQLAAIARVADALTASQQEVWASLKDQIRAAGVTVLNAEELEGEEAAWLDRHFAENVYPIITPQAIDPAHPFPFIPNKGFSLIFDLERDTDGEPIQELLMVRRPCRASCGFPG